jgi:hypothetical protein
MAIKKIEKKVQQMKKLLLAFLFTAFGASALFALDAPQVQIQNLRAKGMGGAKISIHDDQYAIMNNPAAPALLRSAWVSLVQVQGVISGDFLGFFKHKDAILDAIGEGKDSGTISLDNATWNYISNLRLSAGTTPLYFTLQNVIPYVSLAAFDSVNVRIKTNPDVPIPTWDVHAYNDAAAVVNVAMKVWTAEEIGMGLYVGVNGKFIHRVQMSRNDTDIFYLAEIAKVDIKQLDVTHSGISFGMDLGVSAVFGEAEDLTLSLILNDFYKTRFSWTKPQKTDTVHDMFFGDGEAAGTSSIDPSLCIGAAYRVGTILPLVMEDLLVAMDIRDIFDSGTTTFLKIYAGFEFAFLKIFEIRGGIYQGYLSAGLGIHIPILPLEIDLAYWGEELGKYPGNSRLDNFGATVNIVF